MPPYRYTACQLLELFNASRLNADAWTTAIELGIAAKLPTRRGCRGGVRKQRTTQPVIGHRPPTRQAIPNKQMGVDSSNLVQLITPVSALDSCTAATLGLLNVRSLRNKADFITDYACKNDIDILCMTETWLTDNDASLISAIVPHGYKFQHLPRNDRRGGGVGVLFKASFHLALSKPWPAESFECLEVMLRGSSVAAALRIFVVYRPPSSGRKSKPFRLFLEEFGELLERVSIKKTGLVILGDFNVHYGNGDDKDARDLAAILNDINLQQHVTSSTHCRGNILDLVISPVTGSVLTDVSVESLLTDHHVIMCKLVTAKPRPVRKEIFYRKYASIGMKQFTRDLIDSPLVTSPADNIDSLCEQYMSQLLTIIDKHAPVIRRTINVRPRQPWRNDDLQRMRQQDEPNANGATHDSLFIVKFTRTCVMLSSKASLWPNLRITVPRLNHQPVITRKCTASQTT